MSDPVKVKRWHAVAKRVKKNAIGAEVGVRGGRMSRHLLKMIPGLILYMIDRWEVYTPEESDGSVISTHGKAEWTRARNSARKVAFDYGKRAIILECDSVAAAELVPDKRLDFVFIDANHAYQFVKADIAAWAPKIKPGGWLMGHDYSREGVARAVDEIGLEVELDPDKVWSVQIPEAVEENEAPPLQEL